MSARKTILDVFTQIYTEKDAAKPDLCIRLWNHLNNSKKEKGEVNDENLIPKEVTYTLRRLIQGLGSPRISIRKCYFATLVSMLSNWDSSNGSITLNYFKSIVDKQLTKFESKGEEGDVLTGRILAYGVALRSNVFFNGELELQQEILAEMLAKSKERSYLPLLTFTFIIDLINSADEATFKSILWPVLMNEIFVQWPSQTFETLYCILEIYNKYPAILKKKLIMSTFKTSSILHTETIENVQKMLLNITWEPYLVHPLYNSVSVYLCKDVDNFELMVKFWEGFETVLKGSPPRLQQLAILTVFCSVVKNIELSKIATFLTSSVVDFLVNSCRSSEGKKDKLATSGKETLQLIVSRVIKNTDEDLSSTVYKILCKLTFDSGRLLIDKETGVKVVFPCVGKLGAKHVRLMAKKCVSVILLKQKSKETDPVFVHHWKFKDRCYATQLLARLISHPECQYMDWKVKHLKLMMKYALFWLNEEDDVQISNEFSIVLKNAFFTALSHQSSNLENHRMILIALVYNIETMLTSGEYKLRTKLPEEISNCWKKAMVRIQKIDLEMNDSVEHKTIMFVFQMLFLQMALHLFKDEVAAKDVLIELERCYEKEESQLRKVKNDENTIPSLAQTEPKWIEIAISLLLKLLSYDAYLLRQLISRIFPQLCPYLNAQATYNILQALDPNSQNILADDNNTSDDDSSDDEDEIGGRNYKIPADADELEDESDSEIEEPDNTDGRSLEKLRLAVREALSIAGSVSDTESVDLDDIDEKVGCNLDMVLSEAFRNHQKPQNSKNKKQEYLDKTLTTFRIRVLDLVDIYMDNDPPLTLILDTIPVLFRLLEFCIKDNHQRPLEIRLRSTLKKIGNLKKCENLDADVQCLGNVLKALMDKGVRSTAVFLDLCNEVTECCTCLLRIGIQIPSKDGQRPGSSVMYDILINAIDSFFQKRDCLLPISLFENILLKTYWTCNPKLCERILMHAFDPAVRGFRRNQSLSLLSCLYKNTRLLSTLKENNDKNFAHLEDTILENTIQFLGNKSDDTLKPSFVAELFSLLYTIKVSKFSTRSSKWDELNKLLQSFLSNGCALPAISRKYIIKLCSLFHTDRYNQTSRKRKTENDMKEASAMRRNGDISSVKSKRSAVDF